MQVSLKLDLCSSPYKLGLKLVVISSSALETIYFEMVFNESSCVDGKFDGIVDLSPGKENASINVRVLRIWKVAAFLNPSQTGTMEMVLVDHKVKMVLWFILILWARVLILNYTLIFIFLLFIVIRVLKFMPLLGKVWLVCLIQRLKRGKYIISPISQFFHKVVHIVLHFTHINWCFIRGQWLNCLRVVT
jgi:hypothetical protein